MTYTPSLYSRFIIISLPKAGVEKRLKNLSIEETRRRSSKNNRYRRESIRIKIEINYNIINLADKSSFDEIDARSPRRVVSTFLKINRSVFVAPSIRGFKGDRQRNVRTGGGREKMFRSTNATF